MSARGAVVSVVLLAAAGAAAAVGWPLAGEVRLAAGLRCFPDHGVASRFWYLPARLELAEREDGPAFSLHRFRYVGGGVTGDESVFWARGALELGVRFVTDPEQVATARAELASAAGRPVSLEPLPIERLEGALLFTGVDAELDGGALTGGDWSGTWNERSFSLGLEPRTAELLWEAFHADRLALSVGYSLWGRVLVERPPAGSEPEPRLALLAGDALPVHVSPAACPACFPSTDLDAGLAVAYPYLEVYCVDFGSPAGERDLAMVRVEVRATGVGGDRLSEEVRFLPAGGTHVPVHFRQAVRLDRGYEFRTARVFADGRLESDPWRTVGSWAGVLDVSRYRGPAARLDPRQLY